MRRLLLVISPLLLALGSALVLAPSEAAPSEAALSAVAPSGPAARAAVRPDHVVVVVFENKPRRRVMRKAPYFAELAQRGANLTRSYAVRHPSQPNYLALYAGGTMGVTGDRCPHLFRGGHLAKQLTRAGFTFAAYSEGLPSVGSTVCGSADGRYRRKHAPWVNFRSFDQTLHKPFAEFPTDYATLPTVSFVVPDMCHDTHDCSLAKGDRWLRNRLGPYADWAETHNSVLLVTFDEDDHSSSNRIFTALVGEHVAPGRYEQRVDHYGILRTIEDLFGLSPLRHAADATPVTGIWR